MVSHSFVFTADKFCNLTATYSWGNTANTHAGHKNAPEDRQAANAALHDPRYTGTAFKVGGSGLDPYVEKAFQILDQPQNQHANLVITYNCKEEVIHLLGLARKLQSAGQ
jgi:hypothetical protein